MRYLLLLLMMVVWAVVLPSVPCVVHGHPTLPRPTRTIDAPTTTSSSASSSAASSEVTSLPDAVANVVGGTLVQAGDFPSFAVSNGIFSCAGALIWPDVIVTVASCNLGPLDLLKAILFHIGGTQGDGSDALISVSVKKLIPHPDFKDAAQDDIMLVLLSAPVPASKVPLASMAQWNTNASLPLLNSTTTVLGLGCLRFDTLQRSLFQAKVAVADSALCAKLFKQTNIQPNETICTMDDEKGPCLGSYGGPMFDPLRTNTLLGVVSIATTGRRPALANVYTRTSAYTDWITATICQNSAVPPPTLFTNTTNSNTTNSSSNSNWTCGVDRVSSAPATAPSTPTRMDCTPPPRNCKAFGNTLDGTLLRRRLLGTCSDICSPLPWISMAFGWRCGVCQDDDDDSD